MKKELFMNCLRDTGLQALMTECLGEVAAGQTAAQMYLEFEESAAASRRFTAIDEPVASPRRNFMSI